MKFMKTPSKFSSIILLISSLVFSACSSVGGLSSASTPTVPAATSSAAPIVLVDGLEREITLGNPARRIVSLAPSNTEILFAIGAGGLVVGRDTFSDYPVEALAIADIGGGFGELNTEAIVSLDPDLVLAAEITPPEQILALKNLGLEVFALPNPVEFEQLFNNLKITGILTGKEMEAQNLSNSLRSRLQEVENTISNTSERPLVFYELDATDPNAPWTSGPGTFIDTMIRTAGGENLGSSLAGAWIQVSLEELIRLDPDVIILGDYTLGGVTPEMVAQRTGWEGLKAVEHQNVYTFDDNLVSRPGPRLLEGLEALALLLHPELFK